MLGLLGIPPAGRPGSLHLAPSYLHFQPLHSAVPPLSSAEVGKDRWRVRLAMTEGRTRRARPAAGRPTGRAAGPGVRPGSEVWRQRVDRERECVNRDCGLASASEPASEPALPTGASAYLSKRPSPPPPPPPHRRTAVGWAAAAEIEHRLTLSGGGARPPG